VDKERRAIISFITKYRCHNHVKGREIWQKAEAAQVCELVVSLSDIYIHLNLGLDFSSTLPFHTEGRT
jgi:hypothetical protein